MGIANYPYCCYLEDYFWFQKKACTYGCKSSTDCYERCEIGGKNVFVCNEDLVNTFNYSCCDQNDENYLVECNNEKIINVVSPNCDYGCNLKENRCFHTFCESCEYGCDINKTRCLTKCEINAKCSYDNNTDFCCEDTNFNRRISKCINSSISEIREKNCEFGCNLEKMRCYNFCENGSSCRNNVTGEEIECCVFGCNYNNFSCFDMCDDGASCDTNICCDEFEKKQCVDQKINGGNNCEYGCDHTSCFDQCDVGAFCNVSVCCNNETLGKCTVNRMFRERCDYGCNTYEKNCYDKCDDNALCSGSSICCDDFTFKNCSNGRIIGNSTTFCNFGCFEGKCISNECDINSISETSLLNTDVSFCCDLDNKVVCRREDLAVSGRIKANEFCNFGCNQNLCNSHSCLKNQLNSEICEDSLKLFNPEKCCSIGNNKFYGVSQ